MTPKQKALELCQKIGASTILSDDNEGMSLSLESAKKIAILILNETTASDYWHEVKKEIELLD